MPVFGAPISVSNLGVAISGLYIEIRANPLVSAGLETFSLLNLSANLYRNKAVNPLHVVGIQLQ